MVKAAALHLALVIALIISILLGSLIYLHGFYRSQGQKIERWHSLSRELEAGISLSLSNDFPYTEGDSLFVSELSPTDSLQISKQHWGFFDAVVVRCWRGTDTLAQSFLAGLRPQDSTVLYIVDEDRPLSVSGKTIIEGVAILPKSGIRPAFVDGEYYKGIEEMVDGEIKESSRSLPAHQQERIQQLQAWQQRAKEQQYPELPYDAVLRHSFFAPTQHYHIRQATTLTQDSLQGNIVIIADSALTISAHTKWKDALVIAPYIKLEDNFQGSGQFFALDSLHVGKNVQLQYPSTVAVLAADTAKSISSLYIGDNSELYGLALLYRGDVNDQKDMLSLGKNVHIRGNLISFGLLKYNGSLRVDGSVHAYRFITQRPSSLYENYLIDLDLQRSALHPYFIRPHFWTPTAKPQQAIVQWLP